MKKAQNKPVGLRKLSESFIDGTSGNYVEDMYQCWLENRSSVHRSWDSYFSSVEKGVAPGDAFQEPPRQFSSGSAPSFSTERAQSRGDSLHDRVHTAEFGIKVNELLRAYEVHGHKLAKVLF